MRNQKIMADLFCMDLACVSTVDSFDSKIMAKVFIIRWHKWVWKCIKIPIIYKKSILMWTLSYNSLDCLYITCFFMYYFYIIIYYCRPHS